jgi:hypothetical protein
MVLYFYGSMFNVPHVPLIVPSVTVPAPEGYDVKAVKLATHLQPDGTGGAPFWSLTAENKSLIVAPFESVQDPYPPASSIVDRSII